MVLLRGSILYCKLILTHVLCANIYVDDGVNADTLQQWFTRDLVIFSRLDLFRSGDMLTLFIYAYTVITSIFVGHIEEYDWKYWYYVGYDLICNVCN